MTKIYWGSECPENWNGDYPEDLKTVPEQTDYTKTASHYQTLEFISKLAWKSEYMHIERMFYGSINLVKITAIGKRVWSDI